jgi:hypothetical protein
MTQDEIIEMAIEAEFVSHGKPSDEESELFVCVDKDIYKFAKLVAAKAIAELESQEPVAWRAPNWSNLHGEYGYRDFNDPVIAIDGKPSPYNEPLYIHPPRRTWVGLTDEEQQQAYEQWQNDGWGVFYNAIEAKLKEKNG